MSRRDNGDLRCERCRMHRSLCVCDLLPSLALRTRVELVIHRNEARKPTNTGVLATRCLANSAVHLRGVEGQEPTPFSWDGTSQPLFLFPHEGAVSVEKFQGQAVTLVVPDGTWRQAGKVRARTAGLEDVPCVTIPLEPSTNRRLRAEVRPHGMATMEAIARALGILEGAHVREAMLHVMKVMVERTLWLRGELRGELLTGGVPQRAIDFDPRGGPKEPG